MRLLIALLLIGILGTSQLNAQNRVSPLDSVKFKYENLEVEVIYSRPFLKGREFGKDIVPFGKLWRTGANEATTFSINSDVLIEGNKLNAGKYSLYTIPGEKETVIIFNKEWDQWGTLYNQEKDALRVTVPTYETNIPTEQFTIDIDEDTGNACLAWGEILFHFKIQKA